MQQEKINKSKLLKSPGGVVWLVKSCKKGVYYKKAGFEFLRQNLKLFM